jgi:hypothetical protein
MKEQFKKLIETTLSYLGLKAKHPHEEPAPSEVAASKGDAAPVPPAPPLSPAKHVVRHWSPRAAATREELAHVVYSAATGLAKQCNSPLFRGGDRHELLIEMQMLSHRLRFLPLQKLFPGEKGLSDLTANVRIAEAKGFSDTPDAAQNATTLMNALYSFSVGLKTQVIHSPVLQRSEMERVRQELSTVADQLFGMQRGVVLKPVVSHIRCM